jgi:hypothetical protein
MSGGWSRTGCCTDELQTACQGGLDHVSRVDAAFRFPELEQHVWPFELCQHISQGSERRIRTDFVYEANDIPALFLDIADKSFELFFKLASDA